MSKQKKVGHTRHKTTIMWNQKLELSMPDANINSANQSRWRDEDSSILQFTSKPPHKHTNSAETNISAKIQLPYPQKSFEQD